MNKKNKETKSEKDLENKAFYTKYRPQDFDQVLGQEHITFVLEKTLENNNVTHAYLFSGGRGTGKTTVARILANRLKTSKNDLYEIDAASNNSVDEIRILNESVNTLPFNSKYKIYILDEVHMLSKSAFNALLKTLEEPPEHVIFILATTELEKIPETIISRCEVYNFKTPNREILKKMIVKTAEAEGYYLSDGVAELISIVGDGSFRDTHTILQKLIRSSADKKLDLEECERVTGAPKLKLISDCLLGLCQKDLDKVLAVTKNIAENNIDVRVFVRLLLEKFRATIILKIAPKEELNLVADFGQDEIDFLKGLIQQNGEIFNSVNLLKLLESFDKLGRSSMPTVYFEMTLIEVGGWGFGN
jgi:DNA polymerase-3 subunit gamma/tau